MMRAWLVLLVLLGTVLDQPSWAAAKLKDEKKDEKPLVKPPENEPQTRVFSETETQLLLELEQQRVDLERRTQAIELREKLVDLMEKKMNDRVSELQTLKQELEKLLAAVNTKDDAELLRLAGIYGSMKPAAAAVVLNRLDNQLVLDVLSRMPAKKSGKLMEALEPVKARVISEMMAAKLPPPQVSPTKP
jgi:flagellar motility protein MotE (MotC chaperone)